MIITPPPTCTECDMYLSRYESATFDVARVYNALGIAERMNDWETVESLQHEYQGLLDKQTRAQRVFFTHQNRHRTTLELMQT